MKRGFVRKIPALVVAAGLLVSLSACGGSPASNLANCVPTYDSGTASAQVNAVGGFGKDPSATFPTPLIAQGSQVTEISAGKGLPLFPGQVVDFQITAYNATTGAVLTSSSYDPAGAVRRIVGPGADVLGGLLQCSTVGSRFVATTSVKALFGDKDLTSYGLTPTSTLALVLDVQRGFLGKANGVDQLPQAGFPSIALAPNGQPGLAIPHTAAPIALTHEVLKAGSGAKVKEDDNVVIQFTSVIWETKTVVDSTWDAHKAATIVANGTGDPAAGIVPSLGGALIGQRVGSQIVLIVPPQYGYPAGSAPATVPEGSTLIYVLDILGIQ